MDVELTEIQKQIAEKWTIMWWALGFGLCTFSVAYKEGFFKHFKASDLPVIKGPYVLMGFVLFVFMQLFVVPSLIISLLYLLGWDVHDIEHLTPLAKSWMNPPAILGGFGGMCLVFFSLDKSQQKQLFKQTETSWYVNVGMGILLWFIAYPLVVAFSQFLDLIVWHFFHHTTVDQVAVQNFRQTWKHPWLFSLTALEIVLIVPLSEEFLFRGLLQNWLKGKVGPIFGVALSAALFALFHYSSQQGLTNIELLSSLFVLGCALGFIYERQRSLWASIGLHGFFNFMSLFFLVISESS